MCVVASQVKRKKPRFYCRMGMHSMSHTSLCSCSREVGIRYTIQKGKCGFHAADALPPQAPLISAPGRRVEELGRGSRLLSKS